MRNTIKYNVSKVHENVILGNKLMSKPAGRQAQDNEKCYQGVSHGYKVPL